MKRYNFSCYASEKQEAVSRTTTTKPQDFVGEARITRFRLSRGSIPIFYLEPSKVSYSDAQKDAIIANGVTPTDIIFYITQFAIPTEQLKPNDFPNNCCQFCESTQKITGVCECAYNKEYNLSDYHTIMKCTICVGYPVPPTFEKRNGRWYLTNEKYPIYDWDSLEKETIGIKSLSGARIGDTQQLITDPVLKLQVKEENGFPLFHLNLMEIMGERYVYNIKPNIMEHAIAYDMIPAFYTDPILFMNEEALKLFGMNITPMPSITINGLGVVGHFTDVVKLYAPEMRFINASPDLTETLIANRVDPRFDTSFTITFPPFEPVTINTKAVQLTYCVDFDPYLITVPENIYPVSQILITSDELDFQGESISVDTTARQGVIDPSSLHILKSFFVGISDTVEIDASDFVYVDDSLNQSPVIVNNPRICSLTFRVWFLLKTGELQKCILEPGKGFSLQVGLY